MNINRKWASGIGADGQPVYAPKDAIAVGGRTVLGPKDKHYEAAGYKRVIDTPPSEPAPEGYHYEARGYDEDETRIWREYEAVANPPPPPRRWSRRSVKTALVNAGKWEEVKAMLVALDKYEDMLMCDYIEEANGDFQTAYLMAVEQYGKAAVDAIIDSIEVEG